MARILVIDDHAPSREFLSELLRSRAHAVVEAANGREGLEVARRERPDLIFTDLVMPTMDGFEFARRLRGDVPISGTPLIFYTASYRGPEAQALADSCGVARFLTKPSDSAVILAAVDEILSRGRTAPSSQPAPEEFDREHLQLLTDTLANKVKDLERSTAELRDALSRAEAADRLKMAFLANISHEIRTPLNVILGYAELLCGELGPEEQAKKGSLVDGIKRGSDRLIRTMQSVLDIAKLESGTYDYKPAPVRLQSMIEQLSNELQASARGKGLSLTLEIAEPDSVVSFDPYCLSRTLHHLIDNAIKFTTRGGVVVRLRRRSDASLAIEVKDTGAGIDPSYRTLLFQTFSQEERGYTRRFEGSGLGLALAKRFLQLGNAGISFESIKEQGTTFTISFDQTSEIRARMPEPEPISQSLTRGKQPGDDRAVLVVEDDPDTQIFMKHVLGARYRVLLAATGDEARAALAANGGAIEALLVDVSLKGREDGLMLTRSLRQDPAHRHLSIIATTAHASAADRERCLEAGCDAYLAKPFRPAELFSLLAAIG